MANFRTEKISINNSGERGSLQRMLYAGCRVGAGFTWEQVQDMAIHLHESIPKEMLDTRYSLLLNNYCVALERITGLQDAIAELATKGQE